MSDLHWQRRWGPFQELQREMGRLLENLDPLHSTRRCIDILRSIFMMRLIGIFCRCNYRAWRRRTSI